MDIQKVLNEIGLTNEEKADMALALLSASSRLNHGEIVDLKINKETREVVINVVHELIN